MIAKVAILFAALAAVHANVLLGGHGHLVNTGVSTSARTQDAFGNNAFGYTIKDGLGATNSRSEVGDGYGNRKGSYTITDIDGRARRVDYVADGHGFRASVKTNEPGTAASAPAAALINSPYAGPVAPVVNHVAPAASYAAPLAVAAPVAMVVSWSWWRPWFGIWIGSWQRSHPLNKVSPIFLISKWNNCCRPQFYE
ncbi:hypothetical protein CEXT_500351 [Caerostris extrusa]|uniref:Adult-specific rigid cuticular protein 15.7 n=1 Tax=Caerostris extrusa TaxID=172846 RepID=A0AAV4PQ31_CAEEX|nr:hypothetical protein CEXT_500351 [Caerostris extrusa]